MDTEVLKIIFNGMYFGKGKAAQIVGGKERLYDLVGNGSIRCEKRNNVQNGKWFCNAWDCIKYAQVKYLSK